MQRRGFGNWWKSKPSYPLRRNPPGVQVPDPPLEAICERSQMAFSLALRGRLLVWGQKPVFSWLPSKSEQSMTELRRQSPGKERFSPRRTCCQL
jgi:hypothetical protein